MVNKVRGIVTYTLISIMLLAMVITGIQGCIKKAPITSTSIDNTIPNIVTDNIETEKPISTITGPCSPTIHLTPTNTIKPITPTIEPTRTSTPVPTPTITIKATKTLSPAPTPTSTPVIQKTVVGIAVKENATYADSDELVRRAVRNAGGLESVITKGCIVLLKPNVVYPDPPETTVTSWRVVQAAVDMVLELGASKIYIVEASPLGNNFLAAGYGNIKNAELFDMNNLGEEDCYQIKPEGSLTGEALWVPKMYKDADVVITMPKMKTHGNTDVTLSLKNSIGVPPRDFYLRDGIKRHLHDLGINKSIIDLNLIRKPDFTIIDAIRAGQGEGPKNTEFVNSNMIIAAKDIVAADTVAAYYMGFDVTEIIHLTYARNINLGETYMDKIKVMGANLYGIRKHFKRSSYWRREP